MDKQKVISIKWTKKAAIFVLHTLLIDALASYG